MNFIEINGVKVESRILTTKFACDYEVCRGCCCHKPLPGVALNGGALSDYDAAEILLKRKELSELCDDEDKDIVADRPVSKYDGDFYTTICKDKCVLSSMKLGGCVLKLSEQRKVTDIGIPLSCQLYPLLWEVRGSDDYLVLGNVFGDWCDCGYKRGEREETYIIDFLKDAIVRGFGEEFYSKLKEAQKDIL